MIPALVLGHLVLQTPEKWSLGDAHGTQLYVELRSKLFDERNGVRTLDMSLVFTATHKGKAMNRVVKELGQTFGGPTNLAVGDFIGAGRFQIYIELRMNAPDSWIFDYDGTKLREAYARTSGRVDTALVPQRKGGWQIYEFWPKSQYEEEFGSAKGKVQTGGWVLRVVPLRPIKR